MRSRRVSCRNRLKTVSSHQEKEQGIECLDRVDEKFSYRSLDPLVQEIRIIALSGEISDSIECDIEIVALQDAPPFTAWSYTWSPVSEAKKVKVNGKSFLVGETLWEFLHYLQNSQSSIKAWADQICIDQSNESEKTTQVSMMAEIYSNAERVISWLGNSSFDTREALRFIAGAKRQLQSGSRKQRIECHKYNILKCKTMRALIDCKYWNRLWIIQETVRARDLWVTAGDELLS